MGEVIDITDKIRTRQIAESLAGSGKIFCHPEDKIRFEWLPDDKVQTSTVMEPGKAYAIDLKALQKTMDLLSPRDLLFDYRTKG